MSSNKVDFANVILANAYPGLSSFSNTVTPDFKVGGELVFNYSRISFVTEPA